MNAKNKPSREAADLQNLLDLSSPLSLVLKALWFAEGMEDDRGSRRRGLNVLFTSRPGRAKSSRLRAISRGMGLHCETVIGSVREPSDFVGLPVPTEDGRCTYAPPAWAVNADEAGHAVVFLDELNRAVPAVQNAMLRIVLEGVAGDLVLNPNIRFVAAQNPSSSAGAWDLGEALANRFLHLPWPRSDVRAWGSWMLGARSDGQGDAFDPGEEAKRVALRWPSAYARATGLVTAFLSRFPACFEEELDEGDPRLSGAWASARTWEMATRALAAAFVYDLPAEDGDALVASAVGAPCALSYAQFRQTADIPDPALVLDGKEKFKHDAGRLDRTLAFMSGCGALLLGERCTDDQGKDVRKARADVAFKLATTLATPPDPEHDAPAAEATALFMQSILDAQKLRPLFMTVPSFTLMAAKCEPIARAANIGGK